MKKFQIRFRIAAAATLAAAALIFATSCTKDEGHPSDAGQEGNLQIVKNIEDKETQQRLRDLTGMLPTVVVYNSTMDKYISLDLNNPKSFDFASPEGGLSFSSPSGSVQFVSSGGGSYTILTTPASSGGGGGGGIVTAGGVTLDVNYVLCFASGDSDVDGLDLFDLGPSGGEFSGAIGIAGDFEALASGEIDEDADVSEFFDGVVAYYAFAGTPSGNFPVVDFFEFEDDFDGDFSNKGLAYFFSLQPGSQGIFFSKSGSLSFNGGSVEFNGTYFGITGNLFNFDEDWDDANFVEVTGNGILECGA